MNIRFILFLSLYTSSFSLHHSNGSITKITLTSLSTDIPCQLMSKAMSRQAAGVVEAKQPEDSTDYPSDLSREEVEELREAFTLFDTDGNGTIDTAELKAAMESLGYTQNNRVAFVIIDQLQTPTIDFPAFLRLMTARISDSDSRDDIGKVFKLFDQDGKGHVSTDDLQRVARELGEKMTPSELREMVDRADLNGDGVVNMDEFYNVMTKKNFQ
jgi:centrin-1